MVLYSIEKQSQPIQIYSAINIKYAKKQNSSIH